jgi:hypothetical protein
VICGTRVRIVHPIVGLDPDAVYIADRVRRHSIRLRGSIWWFNREDFVKVNRYERKS